MARSLPAAVLLAASAALVADEASAPELGLLEFLGEFEDADGVWIDPLAFDPDVAPDDATRPVTATGQMGEEERR